MLWCPCYWPESRIKIRVAVNAFATTGRECTLPSQYGSRRRKARSSRKPRSLRQLDDRSPGNARQGSRSHFPILVKLFALWWQMLVQTSDITVRSHIAKACAHCGRPDCDCLFRSYAVDNYAIRSFSCLFDLLRTPTRHRSTSLELQLPIPGSCCRRPRLFCCQTNVRRKFSQSECLWSLQTSFSRMFGEIFVSARYLIRQPLLPTC